MAVPSSSQCYQAVRRHLRPHHDSIWVPESLLASTFERYAATFYSGARYGSSVPGPMEHRKRLAKRHMGELHFGQSHSSAPVWDLANLVDLTQWKWSPPTLPDARRRQNVNVPKTRRLFDAALSRLRSLSPPRDDATDHLETPDRILLAENVILSGVAEILPSVSWGAKHTPLDVIAAALNSLSLPGSDEVKNPWPSFSKFCDSWHQALSDGLFNGEAITQILTGISECLSTEFIDVFSARRTDQLKLRLLDATIEGLSKRQIANTTTFDYVAWNSILHEMSTVQMNTVRVFAKAMACIPKSCIDAVFPGMLENLDAFLKALGQVTALPTKTRQTRKMAISLYSLGEPEHRFYLDEVTKMVVGYKSVAGIDYTEARYGWLQLLARLPGVDRAYLSQACVALEAGSVARPLTDFEVCQLFLLWANAQAPLERYIELHNIILWRTETYSVLGALLWKSRQFILAKQFSKFLHAIGRETHIISLVKGVGHIRRGPPRLAKMALGMRRPSAAVEILCLFEESTRNQLSFWESRFGFKALEILSWAPGFNHRKLYNALHFKTGWTTRIGRQSPRRAAAQSHINKLVAVGIVSALSPHISERKALSLMLSCYANIRRHGKQPSLPFLRAFTHHLTRQLKDNGPGITSRLRYALYIIHKHLGRGVALQAGLAMQRRRRSNFGLR
ncbi:hypothetical protein F5B22DRAFT_405785 [Xylaria bambusicola]|uniref:uncharacterized protein n=1 Tax=Xylaria bambusicola TaxID=326684 RepID=UPI002007CF25|nr:uncharacterized protein F5B22DRAFT_405785 [Xylaria bambusicola]KAI0508426.1 hypothetical protein F5B22DRAFT_405785 [Xylaria bambusicola]